MEGCAMREGWRSRLTGAGLVVLMIGGAAMGQGKSAATVNGEAIPMADVEAVLAMRPPEPFPIPVAQQRLLRREALEALISDKLMRQYLAKNAPPIDPNEVSKQIAALTESLQTQ